MTELLTLNGIDATNGEYLLESISSEIIARAARGQKLTPEEETDLKIRRAIDRQREGPDYGVIEGVDPKDLAQTGWGVIFPANLPEREREALREALKPLLDLRQTQAAANQAHFYRECSGEGGYRRGESKQDFLKRYGRGAGAADPDKLPYYLLIAGDPESIPYSFQYQLDVQYAVGRIHFPTLEDYYRYASSVVEAETSGAGLRRRAAFLGPLNPDDPATRLSTEHLLQPLANFIRLDQPAWVVETRLRDQARKADLTALLHSTQPPALLFTASHGLAYPSHHPLQAANQGALLCQDWPGRRNHQGPIPQDYFFCGEDLSSQADVFGMLAFFFACFGAGTPQVDNFYRTAFIDQKPIAPKSFLARLPERLLAHPRGSALAVVGHVDRAWACSFYWDGLVADQIAFQSMLKRLAEGYPIGAAMEYMNSRYAELSSDLTSELDQTTPDLQDDVKIAGLWTSNNDARNYAILGDPAVRAMVGGDPAKRAEREAQPVPIQIERPPEMPTASAVAGNAAAPPAAAPGGAPSPADFGLFDNFQQTGSRLGEELQGFVHKLGQFLNAALDDAATLEVATYVSDQIDNVRYEGGRFTGARLRALTRIKIDGDTLVCVPEEDGEVDTELWQIHLEMLQQAQASRNELLRTVVSAATGLAGLLKP